jgi:hypothetical protein
MCIVHMREEIENYITFAENGKCFQLHHNNRQERMDAQEVRESMNNMNDRKTHMQYRILGYELLLLETSLLRKSIFGINGKKMVSSRRQRNCTWRVRNLLVFPTF